MISTRNHTQRGSLTLIKGCMFSRKTTQLIERIRDAAARGKRTLAIKHAIDQRYADRRITSHDGVSIPARPVGDIDAIKADLIGIDFLAIDEAHFFGPSLLPVVASLLSRGVHVVITGIDLDAAGLPFPPMPELEQLADEVIHTHTRCTQCGQQASFTQRMTDDPSPIVVGGADLYEPRCAACFVPLQPPTNIDQH